jgi:hypothetical protein
VAAVAVAKFKADNLLSTITICTCSVRVNSLLGFFAYLCRPFSVRKQEAKKKLEGRTQQQKHTTAGIR